MKKMAKSPKVNSLSLARVAAQLSSKLEFDLQPFLQDKALAEALEKITNSITKLEMVKEISEKWNASEIVSEFQKTEASLDKVKDKVNHLQKILTHFEKTLAEKLETKLATLQKTEPKDSIDTSNREKVEKNMKTIKQMIETAKKKLKELQDPTETALKNLHQIKPKLYALGIPENFERCQKKAEKLSEELSDLCKATAAMLVNTEAAEIVSLAIKNAPVKVFLPKLKSELEKSGKLLEQAGIHFNRLLPDKSKDSPVKVQEGLVNANVNGSPAKIQENLANANVNASPIKVQDLLDKTKEVLEKPKEENKKEEPREQKSDEPRILRAA